MLQELAAETFFNMKSLIEPEVFALETGTSGKLYMNLSSKVNWEDFPQYAEKFLALVDGSILKKGDAADVRIWDVNVEGKVLHLVFDDYPLMVSLESFDDKGDEVVDRLYAEFLETMGS